MNYICAGVSDPGTVKPVNEDNIGLLQADTGRGQIVMALVCDGVGGMDKGEVASSNVVAYFSDWFKKDLPQILPKFSWDKVKEAWINNVQHVNKELRTYSQMVGAALGTTLIAALFYGEHILMMNVGDSRMYMIKDRLVQLSKDQSLVQREVDLGRLKPEEMESDPRRNVLLQCVGGSINLKPEIRLLQTEADCTYCLCSDGFRHLLTEDELITGLNVENCKSSADMEEVLKSFIEVVKARRESDNISAIAIATGRV